MEIVFSVLLIATIASKYIAKKFYSVMKLFFSCFMIFIPLVYSNSLSEIFNKFIVFGLIVSLIGDAFLLNHGKYFKHGLSAFLTAHIFYAISFAMRMTDINLILIFVYLILFLIVLIFFREILNYSIGIYMFIILLMGFTAANLWTNDHSIVAEMIFIASILFIISDLTLAINKFKQKFLLAELIILATYFSAQFLFALSTLK